MTSDKRLPLRIAILGAGGNSLAIADAIFAANAASSRGRVYELIGFFDDIPENRHKLIFGLPVLGSIEDARNTGDCHFINGIASVQSFRKKPEIIARCAVGSERFASVVHPRAVIGTGAQIGNGSAIMANSVVCPEAVIGAHVIMLECSTVNHHAHVDDFVTISAGVTILGHVRVGAGAFIGGGASLAPFVSVGESALVGMGSSVLRDVEPGTVVAGSPARKLPASAFALPKT